ncbi:MAG: DNA recombination/repair protein RecA, partial [Planctomyces sp.]|nr:DNA recombination/repair protein RecA [Planctomyces sp.]
MAKARARKAAPQPSANGDSDSMLTNALGQIEKAFGKGSIMKLSGAAAGP